MNNPTTDAGLIQFLLEKLEKQRLPGIITSNEKVDSGKSLDETELDYLKNAIADARKVIPLIDRHPKNTGSRNTKNTGSGLSGKTRGQVFPCHITRCLFHRSDIEMWHGKT